MRIKTFFPVTNFKKENFQGSKGFHEFHWALRSCMFLFFRNHRNWSLFVLLKIAEISQYILNSFAATFTSLRYLTENCSRISLQFFNLSMKTLTTFSALLGRNFNYLITVFRNKPIDKTFNRNFSKMRHFYCFDSEVHGTKRLKTLLLR